MTVMSFSVRLIGCVHQFLHFSARPVSTYDTNELFNVVAAQCQNRLPGIFVELRRAKLISGLSVMIKLILYQCAEFKVATLRAVVGCQSDDELRDAPEPFIHLLFHSGFLPTTCAEHYLLGLTENIATFLRERF